MFIRESNVTEPEMCSVWLKNSISYNSCQYSFVIASVGFNIDRVTTQHTPKCVEIGYEPGDLTVHPPPQNCRGWVHFFRIGV